MAQTRPTHYTFGDTTLASERLTLLAETYEPHSRAFLDEVLPTNLDLAVDLGSGLGYTTELVENLRRPTKTVGLERSTRYVQMAKARCSELTFFEQDVMLPPFPLQDADLVYGRFVLTHLDAPERAIQSWSSLLRPGGLLVLEETAHLASCVDEFQQYYAIVASLMAHYGQELYIGRKLDALARRSELEVRYSRQNSFRLAATRMARLHAMNLDTWQNDPFIQENYDKGALLRLRGTLEQFAQASQRLPPVTCTMAQVVLRR